MLAGTCLPDEMNELIPMCKNFALTGTKKQAKQAVRCLFVNVYRVDENIFNDVVEVIRRSYAPQQTTRRVFGVPIPRRNEFLISGPRFRRR